jgi:protoporphyrinogen oxidase
MPKKAIIIGAGPAGLTAAYEFLKRTDIKPIVIEKCGQVGGISKTVDYKGNKMDFGPHRFFSKSDRVMNWWTNIMPLHVSKGQDLTISYQNKQRTIDTDDLTTTGEADRNPPTKSMLVIQRLTRIYFLRQFFNYPIQLSIATLGQLGIFTTIRIICSYLYARLFPRKPQKSLEDFMINKFGKVLYHLFFKDYTEKVWGVNCNDISADWGAQRIKGVSLSKAILHAAKSLTQKKKGDINQKGTETSLIEQFLYPAMGAGAMWEEVARQVEAMGGKIVKHYEVKHILTDGDTISGIKALNTQTGQLEQLEGDYFISTMPIQELITGIQGPVSEEVKKVAAGLMYRDFIYAGVLVKKMAVETLKDSWIYIQEKNVKVARMQIYNNWGPYMINDPDTVWLGLEYFCTKGDAIWKMNDEEIKKLAVQELISMDLVYAEDVLDSTVNRMEKTYPAYFGTYDRFSVIQQYLDHFANLFLVGRNGMHKYNNADHSMLTAMVAVDNIVAGITSKENLWAINTEQEYHEEKKDAVKEAQPTQSKQGQAQQLPHDKTSTPALSFKAFLLNNKRNRRFLWFASIAIIIQFVVFKYLYPFANYIHGDSFGYIAAAATNADVNTHMIGYSRFLRFFSVFSTWDTALVAFQYLLAHASGLFLLFTLFFFHAIRKTMQVILFGFMVINPLFLYMANLVSSDCLFMSLSLIWFSLLLWLLHRPSNRAIFWHTVVLFFAFTVRYNALVYPAIATLVFLLAKLPLRKKIAGIAIPAILCSLFVAYTGHKYQQLTGTWQYAPFSGWQAANNAMYTYRYVDSADRKPVPEQFRVLDNMIRTYFDSTRNTRKYPSEAIKASTAYMWTPSTPLYKYRQSVLGKDTSAPELKRWALMGPFYKEYGTYIIRQYPLEYIQHFLWPNAIRYYAPHPEFLEYYNDRKDSVSIVAEAWFKYANGKVRTRLKDPKAYPLEIYPILTGTMNVVLLCSIVCFLLLYGFRQPTALPKTMIIVITIWILNAAFTIAASPAAIRLQAFPMLLETIFALVLIDWMYKLAMETELSSSLQGKLAPQQTDIPNKAMA